VTGPPLPFTIRRVTASELSTSWLAVRLGTQPAKIDAMRRDGRLIGVPGESGGVVYPSWQFGPDGKPLPVIARLKAAAARRGIDERRLHELLTMRSGLTGSRRLVDALGTSSEDEVVAAIERAR
jgi:hypothetical protein